jgi:Fe-S-cluster-containing hydrogenase component 2
MGKPFATEECTGCRACELACSYHHRKIFAPNKASVHIEKDERDEEFGITIHRAPGEGRPACNCPEDDLFCLNYCPEKARAELRAAIEGKTLVGKQGG